MYPRGMKNDKARKKEAEHQPLTRANKQEKIQRLVSNNTGLLVTSSTKGLTGRLRNSTLILHQAGSLLILTTCFCW